VVVAQGQSRQNGGLGAQGNCDHLPQEVPQGQRRGPCRFDSRRGNRLSTSPGCFHLALQTVASGSGD
jgi:hypothetical protein